MRHQLFVVEPRNEDGSLNTKHYDPSEPKEFITGITEDGIFDFYFRHNKDKQSASQEEVAEWYRQRGLRYRRKTW
jgi:hypothetical protein